jgi:CRP-like cAMP-binding protein
LGGIAEDPQAAQARGFELHDHALSLYAVCTKKNGEVNRLHADDWFGEIGLLRRVPRTATVTTTMDSELLAIPGTVFIDALAVAEVLPDPLRSTMTVRLAQLHPAAVEVPRP